MNSVRRAAQHHEVMAAIGKPKPPRSGGRRNPRKIVEAQLKDIVKLLISWRDAQQCVLKGFDGGRCNQVLEWCHVIPQAKSYWLKWNLSNVFWGCGIHNLLDYRGDPVYQDWYINEWGIETKNALREEMMAHQGQRQTVAELREMLDRYTEMYENRPAIYDRKELIWRGYYGDIIESVWAEKELA